MTLDEEKQRLTGLATQLQQMQQQQQQLQDAMQKNINEQLITKGRVEALGAISGAEEEGSNNGAKEEAIV
jgi:hypothetical protein